MDHEHLFESFLKVAHKADREQEEHLAMAAAMKKLPPETLFKLANGEVKLSSLGKCVGFGSGSDNLEWLEQFKGTPLLEQALQLEQQTINIEMMREQHHSQREKERQQDPDFYDMLDRIALQKRLLGLQLMAAQLQQASPMGGAPPMAAPKAPPPEPPSTPPTNGPEGPPPVGGEKVSFAFEDLWGLDESKHPGFHEAQKKMKEHEDKGGSRLSSGQVFADTYNKHHEKNKEAFEHAVKMGQRMALHDYTQATTMSLAKEAGEIMAKTALNLGAVPKMLGTGGMVGAGLGAAAGLANGLQKDQNGQRHILGGLAQGAAGAVGGAALGHAAQGVGGRMMRGQGLGQAVGNYGTQVGRQAKVVAGAGAGSVSPGTAMGASPARVARPASPVLAQTQLAKTQMDVGRATTPFRPAGITPAPGAARVGTPAPPLQGVTPAPGAARIGSPTAATNNNSFGYAAAPPQIQQDVAQRRASLVHPRDMATRAE